MFLLFIVGYSVSLTEWEGVQSSVDKEVLERISEFEDLCREKNVSILHRLFNAHVRLRFNTDFPADSIHTM